MMDEKITRIIGVDFSGGVEDNKTWFAEGELIGKSLRIKRCQPISREELTNKLAECSEPLVAALDFPFGVPKEFADYLDVEPEDRNMTTMWEYVFKEIKSVDGFTKLRCKFLKDKKAAPKRAGDPKGSFSPLAKSPIDMAPMTLYGMKMLYQLYGDGSKFCIPPLCRERNSRSRPTLLEVMPKKVLESLHLYKPYKTARTEQNAIRCRQNRRFILDGLTKLKPRWDVHLSGDADQLGCAGESLSSVLGE